jgi:YidC/Oxa1 family membrane protein insertase
MNQSFDKNAIIGFVLIGIVLVYMMFTNQTPKVDTPAASTQDSISLVPDEKLTTSTSNEVIAADSSAVQVVNTRSEEFYTLENDKLVLKISNKGAKIIEAKLKGYQTYDSLPLALINEANHDFNIQLGKLNGENTSDMYFDIKSSSLSSLSLSSTSSKAGNVSLEYTLPENEYQLSIQVQVDQVPAGSSLNWGLRALRHEKNIDYERNNTSVYYHFSEKNKLSNLSDTRSADKTVEGLDWIAFRQQFFASILSSEKDFNKAFVSTVVLGDEENQYTKQLNASITLEGGDALNLPLKLYLGPNKFSTLKSYKSDYEKLIPLGWAIFGWINRGVVLPIFSWLEGYGLNYGLIILIMALIIKIVIFPFTYGSYRSMAKMKILKPEIDEINEKYKEKDAMKKQQAMMDLYRKTGVNPLGGCIPLIFQMPILFAVFRFFPASIELRQQSFLWAHDLSSYDSVMTLPFHIPGYGDHVSLFTLLMTLSTIIYTWMNQQLTGQNTQMPQLKYIMYLMPIVFLGIFNNFAAGLTYYYFLSNIITFSQQYAIKQFINEDAMREKIQENKTKEKKPSRFQAKLSELAKQQQEGQTLNRSLRRKTK